MHEASGPVINGSLSVGGIEVYGNVLYSIPEMLRSYPEEVKKLSPNLREEPMAVPPSSGAWAGLSIEHLTMSVP